MADNRTIYTFSGFRLDTTNKSLRRGDIVVSLTPKVFDTLVVLVENAPNLVEKSALMDTLWPGQFAEESNITFNIKMLRKALEDNAGSPKFIETIPRRGYRFIAVLDDDVPKAADLLPFFSRFQKRLLFGSIALLFLAAIVELAPWITRRTSTTSEFPRFSSEFTSAKLTDTGKVNHAVISPDGKYIAYTNEGSGKPSLWLRQISNGHNTEIVPQSDLPFFGLAFSNDSENVFFTRRESADDFQPTIYRVSILGGIPTKIASESQGQIGVTSDDRQIIFVRYQKGVHDRNSLMMVDSDGQNERVVHTSTAPDVFWAAAVSPDKKSVIAAYGHTNSAAQNVSLIEIDLATNEQRTITDEKFFQISSLAWLQNHSGFLFTAYRTLGEPARIWTFDYKTRKIERVTKDSTEYVKVSLSRFADKLVATTLTADFGFFIGGAPNTSRYLTQARDGFSFAPDGRIVYASDASASEDIWIMDGNGSGQKQLTTDPSLDAYPLAAADGHIYFTSNRSGENQIWRMNLDGSGQTRITKNLGGKPQHVSSDGKWLYYTSAVDQAVWKIAADGSSAEARLFPERTGFYQAFSPDGSQMAYLDKNKHTDKFELALVSAETRQPVKRFAIPDGASHPYYLNWAASGLTYSLKDQNGDHILWLQSLSEDKPKALFNLGNEDIMDCRLSPDGKSYVFIRGRWKHDAILMRESKSVGGFTTNLDADRTAKKCTIGANLHQLANL